MTEGEDGGLAPLREPSEKVGEAGGDEEGEENIAIGCFAEP